MSSSSPSGNLLHDVFVSYAHGDDQPPAAGGTGWVTTLFTWLDEALNTIQGHRLKIFMDHDRAPNEPLTQTILSALRSSRTLLVVMSPNYQQSVWCQREVENFVTESVARGSTGNVFIAEISEVKREVRHELLR